MNESKKDTKETSPSMLTGLVQAFSALGIFVFYFGWVSQDSYLRVFGLNISSLDQPFYVFFIQGLQVNFPLRIEAPYTTQWQIWAWIIYVILIILALIGHSSLTIRKYPLISSLVGTVLLVILFLGMHYAGTMAGREKAKRIIAAPGQLRGVTYEYTTEKDTKAKRFSGYLLMMTKETLFVFQSRDLQDTDSGRFEPTTPAVTIVPLDRLGFVRTVGYQIK